MNKTTDQILQLVAGVILSLVVALSSVGLLSLAGWLICAAALAGLHPTALLFDYFMPAAGIRFFAILRILSRYGERVVTHDTTLRILSTLRVWFYRRLEPLVPAYFMRYRVVDLLDRSVTDIDTLDQVYLRIFMPFVVAVLLTLSMLIFFHYFSWEIAWSVSMAMLAVIIVVSAVSWWVAYVISRDLQHVVNRYRCYVIDLFSGMKELLLYAADKQQLDKITKTQTAFDRLQQKLSQLQGLTTAIVIAISGLIIWLILYLGISLVHHDLMTAPVLCMLVLAVMGAFEVLTPLPRAFLNMGAVSLAASRIKEIDQQKPAVVFNNKAEKNMTIFDIDIKQLNFAYQSHFPVLQNFSLSIFAKEKLVIEGPSGAGKTTLLHLLTRIYDHCSGEITIGNIPIKQLSESQLRDTVTLVSQQDYFFNDSVKENLKIAAPAATDEMLWSVLQAVHLADVIKQRRAGLDALMGEFGQYFSAGQLRRFSIARALLRNTPIMLFDEPTEGLDAETAALIWQLLSKTLTDKTVVVVTHLLPKAQQRLWRRVTIHS